MIAVAIVIMCSVTCGALLDHRDGAPDKESKDADADGRADGLARDEPGPCMGIGECSDYEYDDEVKENEPEHLRSAVDFFDLIGPAMLR